MLQCVNCKKVYSYKRAFDKHAIKCMVIGNTTLDLSCVYCKKISKSSVWLNKHQLNCKFNVKVSEFALNSIFNFTDDYFSDNEPISNTTLNLNSSSLSTNFIEELSNFCSINTAYNFKMLHLNINSLYLKYAEFSKILDLALYDIIMLNETKLDNCVPNSAFSHLRYSSYRRDRTAHDGGILVYLKKRLKVINTFISPDYEIIGLQLLCNNVSYAVICAYEPPSTLGDEFLSHLNSFLLCTDLSLPFFLVGDLNMDLFKSTLNSLRKFINDNNFLQAVQSPTRIAF
jgi:hypothetical protein